MCLSYYLEEAPSAAQILPGKGPLSQPGRAGGVFCPEQVVCRLGVGLRVEGLGFGV